VAPILDVGVGQLGLDCHLQRDGGRHAPHKPRRHPGPCGAGAAGHLAVLADHCRDVAPDRLWQARRKPAQEGVKARPV